MRIGQAMGSLAIGFALAGGVPTVALSQPYDTARPVILDNGRALTDEEARAFDARLRAAGNDQVRAKVTRERDDLVRARLAERTPQAGIPASRGELSDDLLMLDVPTPPLDRTWLNATPPAGALAPLGYGTSPFGFPDATPSEDNLTRP